MWVGELVNPTAAADSSVNSEPIHPALAVTSRPRVVSQWPCEETEAQKALETSSELASADHAAEEPPGALPLWDQR